MKTEKGVFVTGTDTEVGKTYVSCALLDALKRQGVHTAAMKPVASGAEKINGRYVNDDALHLQQAAVGNFSYEQINPYVFPEAIAPHVAASWAGVEIDVDVIASAFKNLAELSDFILVEGVGGWLVPLNEQQTIADLVIKLDLPVLLVVGMRLGCINHALLTAQAIAQSGVRLQGWIANKLQGDYPGVADNIKSIQCRIAAPLLATLEYGSGFNHALNIKLDVS